MRLGDVFYWESDQAAGHNRRNKYHVYICEGNWKHQGHIFLFISKSNAIRGYRITNPPYSFLRLPESYVSCNSIVAYDDVSPSRIGHCLGALAKEHLRELRAAVAQSDVMEIDAAKLVCDAIDAGVQTRPTRPPRTR